MIDTYDRFQLYEDAGLGAEEYGEIRRFTRPTDEKPSTRLAKEPDRGQRINHQQGDQSCLTIPESSTPAKGAASS